MYFVYHVFLISVEYEDVSDQVNLSHCVTVELLCCYHAAVLMAFANLSGTGS